MNNYSFFSDDNFWEQIPETKGVYKLVSVDFITLKPVPVQRVCGIDKDGILYIGESQNLRNRLCDLKKSILEKFKSDSHPAGIQYKTNGMLMDMFSETSLAINYIEIDSHKNEETRLLSEYRLKFGELPPLNQKS